MTDERNTASCAGAQFFRRESAAKRRLDAERLVGAIGLQYDADAFGNLAADERHAVAAHRDQAVEDGHAPLQRENVSTRHIERVRPAVGACDLVAEPNQAIRVAKRQGSQEDVIDRAEHRRVRSDAQSEDAQRDQRIERRPSKCPKRVAEVVPKVTEHQAADRKSPAADRAVESGPVRTTVWPNTDTFVPDPRHALARLKPSRSFLT
jgi:hypothetical protein